MRTFEDSDGRSWTASVRERPGPDYKGRFHLFLLPDGADDAEGLSLVDIRWNNERTARRTLETMSGTELRRRLRQAGGRGGRAGAASSGTAPGTADGAE